MIQRSLKIKLTKKQRIQIEAWFPILTSVWNWAIKKIEVTTNNGGRYSSLDFQNLLEGTSKRLEIPSHTIQGVLRVAYQSWGRCFGGTAKKPKLKGQRNKLKWIPFPDPIPRTRLIGNRVQLPMLGSIKFYKQEIPEGPIKCARIIKKASGWYLNLTIDAKSNQIKKVSHNQVGIDPGYSTLLTLSTGEKIKNPNEIQKMSKRISQAQRGHNKKLAARLYEKVANQRKDRNHKLSRRLVAENDLIVFSKDNILGFSRSGHGKQVVSAGHFQLRQMLSYKSTNSGNTTYLEVSSFNSTRTCSSCGSLTGPQGRAGLSVRSWTCTNCGSLHDRDVNAAINTLKAAVGLTVESDNRSHVRNHEVA